jgi:Ser/Thr protein kinase RdoA (MazF antagonist)
MEILGSAALETTRWLGHKLVSNMESVLCHWQHSIDDVIASKAIDEKKTVFELTLATGQLLILKKILEGPTLEPLESEYQMLAHLHKNGVPVALPIRSDEGNSFVRQDDVIYVLTPALPRDDSFELKVYPKLYENIGRAISKLHKALATYPHTIQSWTMDLPLRIKDELIPFIARNLTEDEYNVFDLCIAGQEPELCEGLNSLPMQHIHGDCHGGNVLLHHGDVSGFIDLDHLPNGPRIYDLSYYLADRVKNLIYEPSALVEQIQEFGKAIRGYESEIILTPREKDAIWHGMVVTQLLFIFGFLQHGNAEHTTKNLRVLKWICEHRKEIEVQGYGKFQAQGTVVR